MFLDTPININDLPENEKQTGDFSPIPEGVYNAQIKSADLSPTKDGTGQYIKLRLDIEGPTHAGRVVFANINIKNKSGVAENIGRQQLRAIMTAIGLATINDTDEMIGGNVKIKVAIRPAQGDYPAQNEIKSYSASYAVMPSFASANAPQAEPAKAAPPWAKK